MSESPRIELGPELTPPRPDEVLPTAHLEPYLRKHLPDTDGELQVLQFPGGKANLTYLLQFGDVEYVLRRPPLGPVAPSAHDMKREYRVLSRLWEHFKLAPRSFHYCDDLEIIGAHFQIMERRQGIVIREHLPVPFDRDTGLKRRIGEMLVDILADFHLLDRHAVGLGDLGHPEGFIERQLEGWAKRWTAAAHEDNPDMAFLVDWLRRNRPESDLATLIHNDFKLDNVLVDADDPAQAVAILDWDMCTSGDPLSDLGYLLNQWSQADDSAEDIASTAIPSEEVGFPTRAEVIERYAARTGFDVGNVHWYYAFSTMKFAVIIQQIFIRFHRGQTQDQRFADYAGRARRYIDKGCRIASQGS